MERPRPQELYRHFKGNLYQIVTIATHSETREELVVYQALYGDYKVYCRPLEMFMSEVDHQKYPEVKQKMRFEKVTLPEAARPEGPKPEAVRPEPKAETVRPEIVRPEAPAPKTQAPAPKPYVRPADTTTRKSGVMSKSVDEEAAELNLNPLVIEFMDADLAVDKADILTRLKPEITNDMIDIMAMSMGVVVEAGDVYDRYNDLMTCLSAREKFESTRLRS